jgi:hypothetical protein
VAINRELVAVRPEVYSPQLASSLCNLSQVLAGIQRMAEATRASAEELEIMAPLLERSPTSFAELTRKLAFAVIGQSKEAGVEPGMALLERVARALGHAAPAR